MKEDKRLEKQDQLNNLILRISKVETGLLGAAAVVEIANEFKTIYRENFRHQYSELFPIIKAITEQTEFDADTLLENLRLIRELVEDKHDSDGQFNGLYRPLLKLVDHINLELARFQVSTIDQRNLIQIDRDFSESKKKLDQTEVNLSKALEDLNNSTSVLRDAQAQHQKSQHQLADATNALNSANETAENLQTQLVSVLSIFAAIVIAFSGGISFLGNAISSIQNVIVFKSVLICIICGLILFNLVFLLLYIVGKIINRSIFSHCDKECGSVCTNRKSNCQCMADCSPTCNGIKRIRKRLPYVFWVNIICLITCILDAIAWYLYIRGFFPFNF